MYRNSRLSWDVSVCAFVSRLLFLAHMAAIATVWQRLMPDII